MEAETGSIGQGQGDHEPESDSSYAAIDMLPPEMLQPIYKFLPFPDLLVCREVNKWWKSVATDPVQNRCAPLDFAREDIPRTQRSRALQDFCQLIRKTNEEGNLVDFPVTEFKIDFNAEYYWIEVNGSTLISQLLEAVSPFVKHITFAFTEKSRQIPNIWFAMPQDLTFPHLTKITFKDYKFQGEDCVFSFIRKMIEKCPDIKEFHVHLQSKEENVEIRRWIVETGIEQKASLVVSLKLTSPEGESDFEYLKNVGFKLKHFQLNLRYHSGNTEMFKTFLESQSDTLTRLELSLGNQNGFQFFRELPRLPHLKDLSILFPGNYDQLNKEDEFPTLLYKEQLPALKKLDLTNIEFDAASYFMASHMAPSESLEELILPQEEIDRDGVIRQAARLFPNLKKLQVFHGSAGPDMKDIYENFPRLEELCIEADDEKCVDDFITGLSKRLLGKIRNEDLPSYHLSKALAMLERGTTKTLACLQNLKVLMIHRDICSAGDLGGVDFTELSGIVFKQMRNLQRIDFGVRKYGPNVSAALKEDLETQGIQLNFQRPRYIRSRTDFIESLTDDSD